MASALPNLVTNLASRLPVGWLQRELQQQLRRLTSASAAAPTGLSGGGTMYSPTVATQNPSVMAVECDMGGLYLSTDQGSTWQLLDQRNVRTPGKSPSDNWHRWTPRTSGFALDSSDLLVAGGAGRPLSAYRLSTTGWTVLPTATV